MYILYIQSYICERDPYDAQLTIVNKFVFLAF